MKIEDRRPKAFISSGFIGKMAAIGFEPMPSPTIEILWSRNRLVHWYYRL